MRMPYAEEIIKGIDIHFKIIHFSYELTEKSTYDQTEFRKKEAVANQNQLKFDEKAPEKMREFKIKTIYKFRSNNKCIFPVTQFFQHTEQLELTYSDHEIVLRKQEGEPCEPVKYTKLDFTITDDS